MYEWKKSARCFRALADLQTSVANLEERNKELTSEKDILLRLLMTVRNSNNLIILRRAFAEYPDLLTIQVFDSVFPEVIEEILPASSR